MQSCKIYETVHGSNFVYTPTIKVSKAALHIFKLLRYVYLRLSDPIFTAVSNILLRTKIKRRQNALGYAGFTKETIPYINS
jgi:hypothetical protein